jgi:hypothetical protein
MLTIVLVTASISVGRAFVKLMSLDRGFAATGVVTVNVALSGTVYDTGERRFGYVEEALDRVRRLPGVRSASLTEFLPLEAKGFIGSRYGMDGRRPNENSMVVPVFSDYFRTMGGRILFGREFTEAELRSHARVAVVNERFAQEFGPPSAAVGHVIAVGNNPGRTIIGVVRGMDYMTDGAMGNQVFVPSQSPGGFGTTFVARVTGATKNHVAAIRDAIRPVSREVPVFGVKTMDERLDDALARPQFYRTAVACFAAFALLLATIGIYGMVSYAVARRSHEMGVRLALGTTPERLRLTLLRQGLMPIAAGAIPGILGAVVTGRLLGNLVDGAAGVGAATYAAAVALMLAIAAAGIWLATRPVGRLDIVEVLRAE